MSDRRERRRIERGERSKLKKFCAFYNEMCDQPWGDRWTVAFGILCARKIGRR